MRCWGAGQLECEGRGSPNLMVGHAQHDAIDAKAHCHQSAHGDADNSDLLIPRELAQRVVLSDAVRGRRAMGRGRGEPGGGGGGVRAADPTLAQQDNLRRTTDYLPCACAPPHPHP